MKIIKRLPKNSQYLYTTESFKDEIVKVYRSKKMLYLVTRTHVYSYSPLDLQSLSNKLYDAYGKIQDQVK